LTGRGDRFTLVLRRSVEPGQYVSIRYTERLAEAGIEPSVGSVGDSYDNALAESINGLYKTEVIRRRGAWRSLEGVELATLDGSSGSTTAAYSNRSDMCLPLKPKRDTMPNLRHSRRRRDSMKLASDKPGKQPITCFLQARGDGWTAQPPLAQEGFTPGLHFLCGLGVDHVGVVGRDLLVQRVGCVGQQISGIM